MADEKKAAAPFDVAAAIENAFLMGFGALDMTKDKATEISDQLIERGRMSKSDAKAVTDKIGEVAVKQQEVIQATVAKETDRAMKTAGVATKEDLDEIRGEISEIKELLAKLAADKAAPAK